MVSCVLLSAGLSRRFGSPKALVQWDGQTLIERLQKELVASRVDEVIVVLGADEQSIKPHLLKHKKVISVYNKDYNLGQTSSFQAGLRAVSPETRGILLQPIDVPFVRKATIDDLIDSFLPQPPPILIPSYQGRKGHPPVFDANLWGALLGLAPSVGINEFIREREKSVVYHAVHDEGVALTFNTPEEWNIVQARITRRA